MPINTTTRKIVDAVSMGASIDGEAANVQSQEHVAIQAVFTGTPTGTFTVQGSVDGTNWTTIPLSATLSASGAAGNILAELSPCSVPFVRLVYTRSAGTGTLNAWVTQKE